MQSKDEAHLFQASNLFLFDAGLFSEFGIDAPATPGDFVRTLPSEPPVVPQRDATDSGRITPSPPVEKVPASQELSWSAFTNSSVLPSPTYLLDQPQARFATLSSLLLLAADVSNPVLLSSKPLPPQYLVKCIKAVVCGHQSQLFQYVPTRQVFQETSSDCFYSIPGVSTFAITDVLQRAMEAGARFLRLQYTCHVIFSYATKPKSEVSLQTFAGAVLVALASNISNILYALESHVLESAGSATLETDSILACHNLIRGPMAIINMTALLLGCADLSRALVLTRLPSSWRLLNSLYAKCLHLQGTESGDDAANATARDNLLPALFSYMLFNTVDQWLSELEMYVGLGSSTLMIGTPQTNSAIPSDIFLDLDTSSGDSFDSYYYYDKSVSAINPSGTKSLHIALYAVAREKVPRFLSLDLAQLCADTANCIVLLARHATDSSSGQTVLLKLQQLEKMRLRWASSVKEMEAYGRELGEYKIRANNLLDPEEIQMDEDEDVGSMSIEISDDQALENKVQSLIDSMERVPSQQDTSSASFYKKVFAKNHQDPSAQHSFDIPLHVITDLSLERVLQFQSAFLHKVLVQTIYSAADECNLRDHMRLVRGVLLLGSGTLVFDVEARVFGNWSDSPAADVSLGLCSDAGRPWPPPPALVHHALSPAVDAAVGRLLPAIASQSIRDNALINIGVRAATTPTPTPAAQAQYALAATSFLKMVYTPPPLLQVFVPVAALQVYDAAFGALLRLVHVQQAFKQHITVARLDRAAAGDQERAVARLYVGARIADVLVAHFIGPAIDAFWGPWMAHLEGAGFSGSSVVAAEPHQNGDTPAALSEISRRHTATAAAIQRALFLEVTDNPYEARVRYLVDKLLQGLLDSCADSTRHQQIQARVQKLCRALDQLVHHYQESSTEDPSKTTLIALAQHLQASLQQFL